MFIKHLLQMKVWYLHFTVNFIFIRFHISQAKLKRITFCFKVDGAFNSPDNFKSDPDWRNTQLMKQMTMFKNSSKVLMAAQTLRGS